MQDITVMKANEPRHYLVQRHGKPVAVVSWNPVRDSWDVESPDLLQVISRHTTIKAAVRVAAKQGARQ